jgi:ketosteroid isomerase-like protein
MSPVDTVNRLYEAFRVADMATVESLLAEDVVFHGPEGHAVGGTVRGRNQFFATFAQLLTLVRRFETETLAVAGDDKVAFGHNRITITYHDGTSRVFHNVTSFRFNDRNEICEAFEASTADWSNLFTS